ncbi:aminodeoxychorismate synthase component I [Desulfosporosinus sp. BICA1-9]|uniref:aminodeoxychorismate synthase component I n=1 Tax=Desulfosporosinus sp. BICA1-9 TaxID=1531958 RepID=UPI00054C50C8|nr:aminodeoxychorismate synthase component I [Desulfosporosinus sp. BICA1-9]KJS47824.1 MAG: aminodeoxychorismate synthase [Peptococcaceae bacterium BRH_c23]KJS85883.1 MAG: aminodeoxychorismate synthase [Desulfosporosinus sp. BICA1-9]KJS90125.1 MAG: aminodeoxychorismate synthase [Desulfosporosinus sp. BICA1-9]HBW38078.1 aminodeoxychorismate synthase component I [Desulfosporosinus sp.]
MIFLLDNHDSFTYNLYQYFGELGEDIIVKRQDAITITNIEAMHPDLIVISPGPCTPSESPLSLAIIEHFRGQIPILGVCLGHQAIGQFFGGKVVQAKRPIHGKTAPILHDQQGVFTDLVNPLEVTRYHSLVIERSTLPEELLITAESADGEIMGIRHKTLPIEGIQFHPEAILTQSGHHLLKNALQNAKMWRLQHAAAPWIVKPLFVSIPPYLLFSVFKEKSSPFFLDSGNDYKELGRYSYLGSSPFLEATAYPDQLELFWTNRSHREIIPLHKFESLNFLNDAQSKYHVRRSPFPFSGGAVGFLSYDLKDELESLPNDTADDLTLPLWRFAWYDGIVIYDHFQDKYWITACGIDEDGTCHADLAQERVESLEQLLYPFVPEQLGEPEDLMKMTNSSLSPFSPITPSVSHAQYLNDLKRLIDYIYAGDIYQANLTQRFSMTWTGDPWDLYSQLHRQNPAPFAAFLPYSDFQILCSSPERFIRIQPDGQIETRPIKGTRPRGKSEADDQAQAFELQNSPKDRAELTMIIDLERNDLGRICEFGTVKVPDLIKLEKYPTVWHLASTITGQLRRGLEPSDIIQAVFPGGSITGAPKIRAMEIIEELELYKRGLYTGSIGYMGFDGAWDFNIVIRTILLKNGKAYIQVGGGIVADSIPESEYNETLDKAKALFRVLKGRLDS